MIPRLVIAGILAAALVSAQGRGGRSRNNADAMDLPHAQTQNRLDIIENILKLNRDQRKQVKNILDEGQKQAAPIREQLIKGELGVGDAVAAGKPQEDIDKAVNTLGDEQALMARVEMQAFARIYQLLEKDQQANAGRVFYMMQGIFTGKNWIDPQEGQNRF
jgi:Spy/CpxP family protein refolding chaperone